MENANAISLLQLKRSIFILDEGALSPLPPYSNVAQFTWFVKRTKYNNNIYQNWTFIVVKSKFVNLVLNFLRFEAHTELLMYYGLALL